MRVFLDANILFSAAKSDGSVRQLLKRLGELGHELWVDPYVVAEARRNLQAKGAHAIEVLDALLSHLHVARTLPSAVDTPATQWLPEKDRPVLASAIALRCDALVTGDRSHFGAGYGHRFGGVALHSPRSLAESLLP